MARERMITRTIKNTHGKMVVINNENGDIHNEDFILSGELSKVDALKLLRKIHESEDESIGGVIEIEVQEVLYGMPELEFMAHAKILPERNNKE